MSTYDVVDSNDLPTGKTAIYDVVHAQGLWHRGVHIIIYTPEHKIVMQKRAINLAYHPNEVEISVGGGVDAGETPAQAMVREVKEELGLDISNYAMQFIDKSKTNHRTKTQINRTFVYSYAVCIPEQELHFVIDEQETISAFLVSERRLRWALTKHRVGKIGKISSTYAYWAHLLNSLPPR